MERLIIALASTGCCGFLALLICQLGSRFSGRHPSFLWWFWRVGLFPMACSAYAIFIRMTPREQVIGSNIDYGFLDFIALVSWGLALPAAYLALAGVIFACCALWHQWRR